MRKASICFFAIMGILYGEICAQKMCPEVNLYKTSFVGDGLDTSRIFFPLNFIISMDSIIINPSEKSKTSFLSFRILTKECFWNEDFSQGKSEYNLLYTQITGNKSAVLKIIRDKNQPIYIEILYENGQKRVLM
jgi:hypothetical protein